MLWMEIFPKKGIFFFGICWKKRSYRISNVINNLIYCVKYDNSDTAYMQNVTVRSRTKHGISASRRKDVRLKALTWTKKTLFVLI